MKRTAKAHWTGNLKEGRGTLTTQSGILDNTFYSFKTRFETGEKGTNPEELLAAAHSGCFTMWVSSVLTQKGFTPDYLDTEGTITLEDSTITGIHLVLTGSVPGINDEDFKAVAVESEKNCIISKALSIAITSEAHLIV